MLFFTNSLMSAIQISNIVVGIIVFIAFSVINIIIFHQIPAIYALLSSLLVGLILTYSGLSIPGTILLTFSIVLLTIFYFVNIASIRHLLSLPAKKIKSNQTKYNKQDLYRKIDDTVHSLSKSKTGALITFERSTNLDDYMKNGTIINAPVSQELLETIFYEGTRLHDGAVIIRGNMIVAASVYYTPTTRALNGKFGSRHRAAFGISEVTDSVTVVVSEETGRVSIAHEGVLESIPLDSFLSEFTDMMALDENKISNDNQSNKTKKKRNLLSFIKKDNQEK